MTTLELITEHQDQHAIITQPNTCGICKHRQRLEHRGQVMTALAGLITAIPLCLVMIFVLALV